jgi:hypothetical protein
MTFNLQNHRWLCDIGFRVEVHDTYHYHQSSTFDREGNMVARHSDRQADRQSCNDHLHQRRRAGLFMSFFRTWHAALQRWKQMKKEGAVGCSLSLFG